MILWSQAMATSIKIGQGSWSRVVGSRQAPSYEYHIEEFVNVIELGLIVISKGSKSPPNRAFLLLELHMNQ